MARIRRGIVVVGAVLLAAAGCGSSGTALPSTSSPTPSGSTAGEPSTTATDSALPATGTQEPTRTSDPTDRTVPSSRPVDLPASEFSIAEMLTLIPAGEFDDSANLSFGDLTGATTLAGLTRPAGAGDGEAISRWLTDLYEGVGAQKPVACTLPGFRGLLDAPVVGQWNQDLGWSMTQVDRFVVDGAGWNEFTVLVGNFDEAAIDAAVDSDDDGRWVASYLGDPDSAADSWFNRTGEPIHLDLQDNTLAVDLDGARLPEWQSGKSLADNPALLSVAEQLDAAQVYAARVMTDPYLEVESMDRIHAREDGLTLLSEFDALGVGLTLRDGVPIAVVVYHHDSPETAEQNAQLLPELVSATRNSMGTIFADLLAIEDIRVDGDLVVMELSTFGAASPGVIWPLLLGSELPFVYEKRFVLPSS